MAMQQIVRKRLTIYSNPLWRALTRIPTLTTQMTKNSIQEYMYRSYSTTIGYQNSEGSYFFRRRRLVASAHLCLECFQRLYCPLVPPRQNKKRDKSSIGIEYDSRCSSEYQRQLRAGILCLRKQLVSEMNSKINGNSKHFGLSLLFTHPLNKIV